jgi:hypothetical protein
MLGFQRFAHVATTISGSERIHPITKNHFALSALCLPPVRTPQVWEAVLAA